MKKIFTGFILVIMVGWLGFFRYPMFPVYADEMADIQKQIEELSKSLEMSKAATKPLEGQLDSMNLQLAQLRAKVNQLSANILQKEKDLQLREDKLVMQQALLSNRVRSYYIRSFFTSPFLIILSVNKSGDLFRELTYRQAATKEDQKVITQVTEEMLNLLQEKEKLEKDKISVVAFQAQIDKNAQFIDGEIKKAKVYQTNLTGEIAALSAKQQEIINAKSGNFTFSVGEGELADEYLSSIKGFREAAPGGYFAIFSFGGYTHRNGMSQYGARARAELGQSFEDILKAYYPNASLKRDYSVMSSISVNGYGSMPFEDQYLQGIYEMPGSWHINALKAQAIAARTFAIRYTSNGQSSICADEGCQVFKNSKKGGAWEQAVNETRGWVLVDGGGNPVSTQYASTHGGFSNTSGWDTTDGGGGSNFIDKSYEKLGGSPWLYKAWWRKHYSNSGDPCGRSNPWLSPQEMADIVNAVIAMRTPGIDTSRITPVTTSCWGGNPYSMDELRNLVSDKGGISSANSASVSQGNGTTNTVTINGISMSGKEFRNAVTLRAPGYVRIPQGSYPNGWSFFNIEHK